MIMGLGLMKEYEGVIDSYWNYHHVYWCSFAFNL